MKYFIVNQDNETVNSIKLRDFQSNKHVIFTKDQESTLNEISTIFVTGDEDSIYTDFIENPLFLISKELKKVFEMNEHTLIYKTVVLSNVEKQTQKVYHMVLTDIIDAISDKTTYYKNDWEKNIVLDKNKIQNHNIFQIKGVTKNYFIVSLDVAESILRRGFVGVSFEEVEVI